MQINTCGSCHYFYQHYVISGMDFTRTNCGHCGYPRLKHRKPSATACELFQPRTVSNETAERNASLQFLAKEFVKILCSCPADSGETETDIPTE